MAEKTEIIAEIEALEAHCRAPLMSTTARMSWLRDWCDDLARFPIAAIQAAMRKYRQSEATKFPTPGQLIPLVRTSLPSTTAPADKPRPWTPISDEEYAALSLRDKIRHRSILAQEARRKAGPMWRQSTGGTIAKARKAHVDAADMPDNWHRWSRIAEGHEAEVKRLREHLHAVPRMAAE